MLGFIFYGSSESIFGLLCTMKRLKIPMEIVFLEEGTIHLLVHFIHPGVENYWWVVDTGASKSVVDRALADQVVNHESEGAMATGLGQEMVETSTGIITDFRIGENGFGDLLVAIVDLHHITEEYSKYSDKKIAGLLGSDFFYREKAVIDYENLTILI